MSDPLTETLCEECEFSPTSKTPCCPVCGEEDPWTEEVKYDFDDVELPITFSVEHYDDNHEMWRDFVEAIFGVYELRGSDIANLPDELPSMGYCVVDFYYKLTEDLELKGPFLEKEEARDA